MVFIFQRNMGSCWCFGARQKLKNISDQKRKRDNQSSSSSSSEQPASALSDSASLEQPASALSDSETQQDPQKETQTFTYRELATATKNFRMESLIGRGGFGAVFKGRIESTGQNVAVKMLDKNGVQGDKEFLVEVLMLSLLHHENLVKLIGYCAEVDQRLLVYEYMPLGSLEDHIHDLTSGQKGLDWQTRMRIAAGAAKGIEYLHSEANPAVIYRDLKTANILLDHGYKAKLSDFGLAKFGPSDDMSHVSTRVMGTHGYCAPEYANSGKLTLKSDIYSFGVVLLELITGRQAILNSSRGPTRFLVNWARPLYMDGKIKQIVDPKLSIKDRFVELTVENVLELTFMCLREEANARPSIRDVVKALDYIVDSLAKHVEEKASTPTVSSPKETTRMLIVHQEEEDIEREKAVAEANTWAKAWRQRSGPSVPTP